MDNIRALVSDELSLIEKRFDNIFSVKNEIFAELNNFLLGKSKRVRSLITLLILKADNISINQDVISLLAATELIHNASLLHDDVIDNSTLRRGIPNIYSKYGAEVSVLAGDYLLSDAVKILSELNNTEILKIFLNSTTVMSEAEIVQFNNRNCDISLSTYLKTAEDKTASLFKACLASAAILTEFDRYVAENFALNFGILFQINNDLQSESVNNDKLNNIKTAVDIIGIEKTLDLKDNYKEELSKILMNFPENKYKKGIEDVISLL